MSQMFFELVHSVEQSGKFQEILKTQQIKYQLQPFKIQGIDCEAIKKTYESIQEKYQNPSDSTSDPNNWNENERRVFIWFIIFYTYFKDISSTEIKSEEWSSFSKTFFNKNPQFLHFQLLNMIKPNGKINWTREQDEALIKAVQEQQNWRWNEVAKSLFYNSDCKIFKSPKHCRQRWLNHLDDKKKRGLWTPQQDLKIFKFVLEYGKRWCKLVSVLKDTRTQHMIKNRYNSLINKQRKSKKEREEQLCLRILKQLKKQITNSEIKKRAIEAIDPLEIQEPKIQNLTPEQKANEENLNTNSKDEKTSEFAQMNEEQADDEDNEEIQNEEQQQRQQEAPAVRNYVGHPAYYPMIPQPFYGYPCMPQMVPYGYQPIQPMPSYYWM